MKKRQGQALIIVVIIIAVVMAVFANSLTTRLRYHSREETEIYQREQALYLAEMGINQMIFKINNGTAYNEGGTITGSTDTGSYTAVYHVPDSFGFRGPAHIESKGTVGSITRRIFVSIPSEAFKYCLYTTRGGNDGVDNSKFTNKVYSGSPNSNDHDGYKYNGNPGSPLPYPDMSKYSSNYEQGYYFTGDSATYQPFERGDNNKVVYIEARGTPPTTLTVDFQDNEEIQLSLATNATNITIENMKGSFTWSAAHEFKEHTFPIITHSGTGKVQFNFNNPNFSFFGGNLGQTLYLQGFIYTAGYISMKYLSLLEIPISYGEIDGEVIEKKPHGDLGGDLPEGTTMKYETDYNIGSENHPPYFIIPAIPGTFREEY